MPSVTNSIKVIAMMAVGALAWENFRPQPQVSQSGLDQLAVPNAAKLEKPYADTAQKSGFQSGGLFFSGAGNCSNGTDGTQSALLQTHKNRR